jgi:transposase
LIPRKPGERIKTNRRDAVTLARLFRAGELTPVWVPDAVHEAVRDLVRAREAASQDFRKKRQQLLSFLLRHGRIFSGRKHWTLAHLRWLAGQKFEHPAQQIVFQDAVDAIEDAAARLRRLDEQLLAIVPSWSMAPVVDAYQAMRGVSFIVAVTFVAEIGDVRHFDNPRQLMAFLGLVPAERSTGERVRRAGLTLAGNRRARRVLIEGLGATATRPASARLCELGSRGCRKLSATSPGRLRSACARGIAGSALSARRHLWSSPRSKWRRSFGPSAARSRPPPDRGRAWPGHAASGPHPILPSARGRRPGKARDSVLEKGPRSDDSTSEAVTLRHRRAPLLHSAGDGATEGNPRASYVAGLRPTPAF